MKSKYLMLSLLAAFQANAAVNIDFETAGGYTCPGVYDVWEESPFRTGALEGNWAITDNPDTAVDEILGIAPNPSAKVLGAQRSRFGSNRFGVRIDLDESFQLTPTLQYVHVMLHKPVAGRVMLVGLGSRTERTAQNPYCEQFWVVSTSNVEPGKWCDAVFPIKGVAGINIRSLVVVPDLESPHNLSEDFLFYVDNIEINTASQPRVIYEYYPVTGSKSTSAMTRTDRVTSRISLKCGDEEQSLPIAQQSNKKVYQDLTNSTFYAMPGQTITPAITYDKDWMHAYCYIDFDNNGKFTAAINSDGTPAQGSELVSYNSYSTDNTTWKNSLGQSSQQNPGKGKCGLMPSFTLPADMAPGVYRMRYKLDWNYIDPAGNPGDANGKNLINDNGGMIADVMLTVCGPTVNVNDNQLNGEVLAGDGSKLTPYKAPYGQDFVIKMNPENGFHHDGFDAKVGFNLDGEPVDKYGNPQYIEYTVPGFLFADNLYTIPANKMRGNVLIEGRMIQDNSDMYERKPYERNFPDDLTITRDDRSLQSVKLATSGDDADVTITPNDKKVFQNHTATEFSVKPGETITATVNYNGRAMHTYWYVDLNEDGVFNTDLNADGTPCGELLSYSCYQNRNSLGQEVSAPGSVSPGTNHPFVIPADTEPGYYRARFKIDWNNIDPAGQYGGSNNIDANGGYVVDFYVHVHDAEAQVVAEPDAQAGSLLDLNGGELHNQQVAHGVALAVAGKTGSSAKVSSLTVKSGYRLDAPQEFLGHKFWQTTEITPDEDGVLTIPAEFVRGTVTISAKFDLSAIDAISVEGGEVEVYDLQGRRLQRPVRGINIVNRQKQLYR